MDKIICANGDSFTNEYYLEAQDRWTNIIGAKYNLSLAGCSNDRIFHTTMQFLNQNETDILIIGWTDWARFMLPTVDGQTLFLTPMHTGYDGVKKIKEDSNSLMIGEFYYKHIHNDFYNFKNMLNYMIFLQNYCAFKKIKLLYFFSVVDERWWHPNTLNELAKSVSKNNEETNSNLKKLQKLIDLLDGKIWIKKCFYSMIEHCKDFRFDNTMHPQLDGSKHWANLVKEYL
jgi:hypothetical protein